MDICLNDSAYHGGYAVGRIYTIDYLSEFCDIFARPRAKHTLSDVSLSGKRARLQDRKT